MAIKGADTPVMPGANPLLMWDMMLIKMQEGQL